VKSWQALTAADEKEHFRSQLSVLETVEQRGLKSFQIAYLQAKQIWTNLAYLKSALTATKRNKM